MLSQTEKHVGIIGLGSYVPNKILNNFDFGKMVIHQTNGLEPEQVSIREKLLMKILQQLS